MNTSIPKNIKRLRQQKGLTQEQLAEKLFVTRQTVSLWETGKTQPDIQTLERIAAAFGVELMIVLYGEKTVMSRNTNNPKMMKWIVITSILFAVLSLFDTFCKNYLFSDNLVFAGFCRTFSILIGGFALPTIMIICGSRFAFTINTSKLCFLSKRWLDYCVRVLAVVSIALIIGYYISWFGNGMFFEKWFPWRFYRNFSKNSWVFIIAGFLAQWMMNEGIKRR